MNTTYSTYLQSNAWMAKRARALALADGRCRACGTREMVQVHHLTYSRIFKEEDADLMALCVLHHQAAEEMIRKGAIPRDGNTAFLAEETLRFIAPVKEYHGYPSKCKKPKEIQYRNKKLRPPKSRETKHEERMQRLAFRNEVRAFVHRCPQLQLVFSAGNRAALSSAIDLAIGRSQKKRAVIFSMFDAVPRDFGEPSAVRDEVAKMKGESPFGWTKEALAEYGISWPPQKGWKKIVAAHRVAERKAPEKS